MDLNELLKTASQKPEVRDAIVNLAKALEKKAQSNAVTKFDETVPVMVQPTQQQASGVGISGTAQPQADRNVPPAMVDQAAPATVVPPGEMGQQIVAEPAPQAGPEQAGTAAAQEFLAPVFEAAMQGDPNAQAIIAQAAGNIAMGVAAATQAMPAQEVPVGPDGQPLAVGPDGQPVAPVTPEEAVANQIVPEQAAPAADTTSAQPPVGEESGKDTAKKEDKEKAKQGTKTEDDKEFKKMSSISFDTFRTLLDLARAGKI